MNITYAEILAITQDFYELAKRDILIGYHFRVIDDFDEHIPRIAHFWNLQLTGQITDRSQLPFDLITVHRPLKINLGEIDRWEKIFHSVMEKHNISKEIDQKWRDKIELFKGRLKFFLCT